MVDGGVDDASLETCQCECDVRNLDSNGFKRENYSRSVWGGFCDEEKRNFHDLASFKREHFPFLSEYEFQFYLLVQNSLSSHLKILGRSH